MNKLINKKVLLIPILLSLFIFTIYLHAQTSQITYPIARCSNTYANQWVTYNSSNQAGSDILGNVTRALSCTCPGAGLDDSWYPYGVDSCASAPALTTAYGCNRCSNTNANQWVQYISTNPSCTDFYPNTGVFRIPNCGCPSDGLDTTWNPSAVAACAPAVTPPVVTPPVVTPPTPVVSPLIVTPPPKAPTFTLTPTIPRPTLSYTVGDYFNNGTNNYETNNNYLSNTDNYLILKSNDSSFASSNNQIYVNGNVLPPTASITYQSTSQINIFLGTLQDTAFSISVGTAGGTSLPVTVTAQQVTPINLYPTTPTPIPTPPVTLPSLPTIPTPTILTPTTLSPTPTTTLNNPTPLNNSNPLTITQTPFATKIVLDGAGISHTVNYYYLPDGEVKATFSYNYTYSNMNVIFPATARGLQNYVFYTTGNYGIVQSNGTIVIPNVSYDCYNFNGAAGCLEDNSDFIKLLTNITTAAPPTLFPPGISFATLPTTPLGTYITHSFNSEGTPVHINLDANGNLISTEPVTGNLGYWYNLGSGYYVHDAGYYPNYAYLEGPAIPSSTVVLLENLQVSGSSLTTSVSVGTSAELAKGFPTFPIATEPISFAVEATSNESQTINASQLQIVPIPNSPTTQISAFILYHQVNSSNQLFDIVNNQGVADYQALINQGGVIPLSSMPKQLALSELLQSTTAQEALDAGSRAGLNVSVDDSNPAQTTTTFTDPATNQIIAVVRDAEADMEPLINPSPVAFLDSFMNKIVTAMYQTPVIGNTTGQDALCSTNGVNPGGSGKLTQAQADQMLADECAKTNGKVCEHIPVGQCTSQNNKNCASFTGIRQSTINGVIALGEDSGCPIVIQGGTEVGHSAYDIDGLIHQDGWKLDVGHNTCLDSYIENINSFSGFYQISNRPGDGAKQWWDSATGAIYALEGTHWDIVFPPQPANIPVNLAISYDPTNPSGGGIYGINDDYTYSFNCAQDDSLCSTVQGQLNTVIGLFNAANGPQGSSSVGVTNAFNKINVTYYPDTPAGVDSNEASLAHSVFNPSQGVGTCQINIYGSNLQNIANQYAAPNATDSNDVTNLIAGAIQQQMFTCFGVADENFTGSDPSSNNGSYVMGPGVNVDQAQWGAIPLKNDPTNISQLLQAIKNKTPIPVNNCVPINSAKQCNGQTYSLSQHKCIPNPVASNGNTHPPMSGYDCTCDLDGNPTCTKDQNIITDPATIEDDFGFYCPEPTTPIGVTCECFNGEPLGCTDTNGKPVSTPSDYQCEQPPN